MNRITKNHKILYRKSHYNKRESAIIRTTMRPNEVHEGRWLEKLYDEMMKEPVKVKTNPPYKLVYDRYFTL